MLKSGNEINSSVVRILGTSNGTVGYGNIELYVNVEIRCLGYKRACLCNGPFDILQHCCFLWLPLLWGYYFARPRSLQILKGSEADIKALMRKNASLVAGDQHTW